MSVIQKILSINPKCDCLSSGDCILSNSDVNDLKFFLYCDRLPLLQFLPCYDEYSNQNLTAFLKIVDRDNTTTEVIVPSEVGHKCIIISRDDTESDICIPCNMRFEKDWDKKNMYVMCVLYNLSIKLCIGINIQLRQLSRILCTYLHLGSTW